MRTTAYLKAIMEVYGKTITGLGPDGLKVTSQFDAHVYICERSKFNIVADWIGFSTVI